MKIVKRDGKIVDYNPDKIRVAIDKANQNVSKKERATPEEIEGIKYMTHSGSDGEYKIANDSMEDHYTTLFDIKDATNHKWTMNGNVWSCANENVISLFLDFTAPCFLGLSGDKANYFSLDHVEVEQKGETLELRLVTTGDSGKLTDENGVLSVATITK